MKKFLALLGALGLTATSSMAVVACGNKEDEKTDLSSDKLVTNLEEFEKQPNGVYPSNKELLASFNKLNKENLTEEVKMEDVEFGKIAMIETAPLKDKEVGQKYQVKITAKKDSAKFKGEATIIFSITKLLDLDKLDFHLEDINLTGNVNLDASKILEAINEMINAKKTEDLDLKEKVDVEIKDITDIGAKIVAIAGENPSTKVKGQADIKFNLKKMDINAESTRKDLGIFIVKNNEKISNEKILEGFISKNPSFNSLKIENVTIDNITETGAKITINSDSKYLTGSVNVNFTIKTDLASIELKDVEITVSDLKLSQEQIIKLFFENETNKDKINKDQVNISSKLEATENDSRECVITFTPKGTESIYSGSKTVKVTFVKEKPSEEKVK